VKDPLYETCLFCEPEAHGQAEQVLLRSDNFFLFAGLGPLIEGYIIIAPHRCDDPRFPYASFSEIPQPLLDEAIFLRGLVSEFYRDVYHQESSMHFEHGRAGVCFPRKLDTKHCHHAHLCCYPCSLPLWDDMVGFQVSDVEGLPELGRTVGNRPYLYVQSSFINHEAPYAAAAREYQVGKVAIVEEELQVPRQYLRRLLAARLGIESVWDWALVPQMDLVQKAIEAFHKWLPATEKYELEQVDDGVVKLDFLKSVEKSNRVGNNDVANDFHRTWAGREQYGAVGRFLSQFPDNLQHRPRILDVGCGPGHYLKALHSLGLECVGIDISEKMVDIARQVNGANTAQQDIHHNSTPLPTVQTMSVFELDFDAASFDGIWYSAVLVHVPRGQAADNLARLEQILKKDGVLYVSAQLGTGSQVRREGRVFFYYTEDELKLLFDQAGFQIVQQWGGETHIGSKGDTRKKAWIHFLLKKKREQRLSDLGERGLLERIENLVPRTDKEHILLGIGDDCASIKPLKDEAIVLTIDPCPQPVISILEGEDRWYDGWFSMIINISDLASMGAKPLGILLALEAENDMLVTELDRFYEGILDASREFDCPVIGGNVKDATRFSCVGAAIGSVHPDRMLRRDRAKPGELVVVLGEMGRFWAGVIHKLESIPLTAEESLILMQNLQRPRPRIAEGRALAEHSLSRCAMDSSDGLVSCFYEIARASSGVDIYLDLADTEPDPLVSKVAELAHLDVRKLMLSWGNWELVTTVTVEKLARLSELMANLGCPVSVVGTVEQGSGKVWLRNEYSLEQLNYLASERFTKRSYFSHGLDRYLQSMRREPLVVKSQKGSNENKE
jgi:thiamine-monophosphate kinase